MRKLLTGLCALAALIGACSKTETAPASQPPAPAATQTPPPAPSVPPASTPAATKPDAAAAAPAAPTPLPAALSDREKIEKLLQALAASPDTFTRNESDYTGAEAAAHLRSKWTAAGDRVKTVRDFIDGLGSKSSMSGKLYTVRRADGTTVNAGAWFNEQLKLIEAGSASAGAAPAPARTP